MKDGSCDITKEVSKTLNKNFGFFSINESEVINETWKKSFYDFVCNI